MSNKNHNHEEELKHQNAEANMQEEVQHEEEQNANDTVQTLEEQLQNELEAAKKENEALKDKYLRLSAEFDNFRKRTMKEKAEL